MNSFGLGLVLNFVDNATSGMGNATRAFQQMSQTADAVSTSVSTSITDIVTASYALDSVGTTLMNTGSSIISLYSNVSQSVIDAGMEMQGYRMQLSALYGSIDAGEAKMREIKDYAMSSVFDIQSLIPAVTIMKAVGIEAMNEITTSSGQNTQKLLDYASDLAAMMPNMRNAYGTGVSAAMGAFKEYIAEGNAMSLKRGAGLDITQILGEDKGATIEGRTQQVADLIEQLNIVGYTANLAGTPTQRLSNMQDALFNSLTKIADSGVFERYCVLLEKLSNWVFSLVENEETFNAITGVLADTVTTLLSPLEYLLDFLIENGNAIIDWVKENPELTKNILLTVAAVGGFLIVGGALLKLISSIGMASAGFNFLKGLPSLLSIVGGGFAKLIFKALPFVGLAAAAYVIWSDNIFGIRDTLEEAGKYISGFFTVISDAWGDNELSQENYDLANSLGILPLIESLLMLKYYWGYFVEGFKTGFSDFFASLQETLGVFGIDIGGIFESVGKFLRELFDIGQEDKWSNIGEKVGKIAGIAVSLFAVFKVLSLFKPLMGLFKGGIPFLGGGKGGSTPASPTSTLKNLGNLAIMLVGLAGVLTVIGLVSKIDFSPARALQVIAMIGIIGVLGSALSAVSSLIGNIPVASVALGLANIAIIVGGLTGLFTIMGLASSVAKPKDVLAVIAVITVLGVLGSVLTGLAALIGLIPIPVVLAGIINIGLVVGALTGLAVLISEALPTIGKNFNEFITAMEPAFDIFTKLGGVDMSGLGDFFTSLGAFMLQLGGDKIISFFTGKTDLSEVANQLVTFATTSKQAFDAFAQIPKNSFDNFFGVLDALEALSSTTLDTTLLTSFPSKGYQAGQNLMQSLANSILSNAYRVKNALQSAVGSISITASPSVSVEASTSSLVGLSTGGYVKETGVAVLHPDEVVVNDDTTRKLNEFLSLQNTGSSSNPSYKSNHGESHNDYSVTFAQGSVIIQLSNASETELEKAADKLMKIIERKQQLKAMAVRS